MASEEERLHAAALKNAESTLIARERAERDLLATKEALQDARMRLQAALSAAEAGTWIWDVQRDVVVADENLASMFSIGADVAAGAPLERYIAAIHPDDRQAVRDAVAASLASEPGRFEMDLRLVRHDGSIRWVTARGTVRRDETGTPVQLPGVIIDITERKRTEQALREGADRLQLALSAGDLGNWSWDARTDLISLSPRAAEIYGIPADASITRQEMRARLLPEDGDRAQLALEQAIATRSDYSIEYHVRRPSGERRWVSARGRAKYADDGELIGMAGVVQDVSDLRNADEVRNRLAALVASSDDAIISKTLDGIIVTWNQGAERMFGYTADEVVGRPVTLLIPPEHVDEEPGILERLRRGERIDHYETVRIRKDGGLLNVSLSVSPIRNADGQIVGASKIARDITQQKRAEETLRTADSRFRLMADSAPVLVWMADTTKGSTWFNKPWLEFTGRDLEQELGFGWIQNVHQADLGHCLQTYTESFDARQPFRMEYRLGRHDGVYRWLMETAVPLYEGPDQHFSGYIGTCIDITELRQAEIDRESSLQAERAARSEAERLGRLKDEFLATLSHELRTPLNAILGWATLLRRLAPGAPDQVKGLETIERNARVQARMIDELLDMSRIISGKVQLDVQPVDLHQVISAALDAARPSIEAKKLRLRSTLDAKVGRIRGDPGRLQQVFWNLLTNAVKFTPAGGRIDVVLERVNSHVEVTVEDSGIGIKPEFLGFVFDRFRQGDASITRRHGGLGLGLSIVKQLIELHGGSVRVKSPGEGGGSTFIVALPISVIHSDDGARNLAPRLADVDVFSVELPSLAGVTVLVVDDEPDARVLINRLIEERGGRAVLAAGAEEAVRIIEQEQIDIVISDIGMPDVDGYQLIRQVRSIQTQRIRLVPAIALTAYARADDRQRALLAGYQMHLPKPVEPRELVAGIASLLNIGARAS